MYQSKTECMHRVVTAIAKKLKIQPSEIRLDSTLNGLGIDSLDYFELVSELQEEAGLGHFAPDKNLRTVQDIIDFIESKTTNHKT